MKHKEKILELRALGYSYKQIQDELQCSKGLIAYHLGIGQKEKTLERSNLLKAKRRREMWKIKEESGCIDCGEKYPHYILEFDHRPGTEKLGSVSEMYANYGIEVGFAEAEKCDIVCANCHKLRTYNRNQFGIKNLP